MDRVKSWFNNLSKVGKVSLIMSLAMGSLITASAMSPKPNINTIEKVEEIKTETRAEPVITTKTETETEIIPFEKQTVESDNLAKGVTNIETIGVNGEKVVTYEIILSDGLEKSRTSTEVVTVKPINEITVVGTHTEPVSKPASNCDPNYSNCVPIASDVDCSGGSGNGPAYVSGPVQVIGTDIYGLDRDGDGWGCE